MYNLLRNTKTLHKAVLLDDDDNDKQDNDDSSTFIYRFQNG